nr:rhomboid family intramembrane serine protease [Bacteroidota bacterium]
MYSYQNPLEEVKQFFRKKTILGRLIIINVAVFLLVNIVNLFLWLLQVNNQPDSMGGISIVTYYFAVPASLQSLFYRPWTLFTYMFLHEGFFHIFFNMFVLYFGGRIFMEYLSEKKLLNTYIFGGLAGAIFYIAAFNIFPVFSNTLSYSVALGASASVLAILIAVATYVPEYSVVLVLFGKVKLKYLALAIIAIDVLSISRGNAGGHIAHLGGALWGFLYIKMMKQGTDFTVNFASMNLRRFFKYFTKAKNTGDFPPGSNNGRPLSDDDYNFQKKHYQERIDKILDKISKSGYNSLTREEKELLFKSSKRN